MSKPKSKTFEVWVVTFPRSRVALWTPADGVFVSRDDARYESANHYVGAHSVVRPATLTVHLDRKG
jgi:hypothetical protein